MARHADVFEVKAAFEQMTRLFLPSREGIEHGPDIINASPPIFE
jgi:hypothetical protein